MEKELAERYLSHFIRQAWQIIEPGTPYIHGWHIDVICDHLEAVTNGDIKRLLINIPPRHMKSILVSVMWPVWEWIKYPHLRYVYSSYAYALSTRDSVKSRRLIQSPWFQRRWGDRFSILGDQNEKTRYENSEHGFRLATSVTGLGTGEGGDRIVVDDPHNVREAESDVQREGVLLWWDEVMSTRINNPKTGARVIIMQRVHEGDLAGHVLEKGGYTHLCLPARYEGKKSRIQVTGFKDPRKKIGQLLWTERFPEEELAALETEMGEYASAGQLQQRPSPREGGILKKHWWRYWHYEDQDFPPVKVLFNDGTIHECENLVLKREDVLRTKTNQSWDMTFKDTTKSDFVCGGVWAKIGANAYLLDSIYERLNFPNTIRKLWRLKQKWPNTERFWIEDKANGPAIIQVMRDEVPGLIAVNPEGDKMARVHSVTWVIEGGNAILPHPKIAPWVKKFTEQCATFPNAVHDDYVDMLTQALRKLFAGGGVDLRPQRHWIRSLMKGR